MKKIIASLLSIAAVFVFTATALAATTVTITGNTSSGENQPGWFFNRDVTTSTPFEFNSDKASIGVGSLYVLPIGANASDKFIAENFQKIPVEDLNSISYDFLIAGNGDSSDANQFYLNVYTNFDDSDNFYSCRFDYVPTMGSTSDFTTVTFESTDVPVNVQPRPAGTVCPATLAEMPAGSYIRAFSISVGDTTNSDTSLAGYLDNVVVDLDSEVTTYDFEPALTTPISKNECKDGGWSTFNSPTFKNQGDCVSYVQSSEKAVGNKGN